MVDDERLGFYVFDNLRCVQDGEGSSVYRFETLDAAAECFERMPKEWTTALGAGRGDLSELDLVQRRQGEPVLVTDFANFPEWEGDARVQRAIGALVNRLDVRSMLDQSILKDTVVLPLESFPADGNRYLSDKKLRPRNPSWPHTSINEAYVQGEGWVNPRRLAELAASFGYSNPSCPTVTMLNVEYVADDGRIGQMDVTPREYGYMVERTLGKGLTQRGDSFDGLGTPNRLMERVQEWREAAAAAPLAECEERLDDLARKARSRAVEKNVERPEKAQAFRSSEPER